jgi:hypothetical protein
MENSQNVMENSQYVLENSQFIIKNLGPLKYGIPLDYKTAYG